MNKKELKLLHNKIIEIAEYFDTFCNENNIRYYLMGGTALGAIRHKGFIPWDDDFDVFMDYDNYSRFLNIVDSKIDKKRFYFQKECTEEWPLYFSKLRMNNTTFIEKDVKNRIMHHGIYIDIMCLNSTPNNKISRYFQYCSARALNARALFEKGYITKSFIKKTGICLSKIFIRWLIKKSLLNYVRKYNSKNTEFVGHFFGRAPFSKTSFPKNYLKNPKLVKFENLMLPVALQVEKYLKVRYGDNYMELPSEDEKMKYPSHAYIVDTIKDYKNYIS